MDKSDVAAILDEIGTLLEIQGENSFKCNAYHNAARTVSTLSDNLADLVAQDRLKDVPGIGEGLREKSTALVTTGKLPYYDDLRAKTPPGLLGMLRVPGLGPKKISVLNKDLGLDDDSDPATDAQAMDRSRGLSAIGQAHTMNEGDLHRNPDHDLLPEF